jgi:signal transduction histidine kinase
LQRTWGETTIPDMGNGEADSDSARPSDIFGFVLGTLARSADIEIRSVDDILRSITETAARTLLVARVNIWLFDGDRARIRCVEGYDATLGTHESGEVLEARDYPSYFSALELLRNIAAMDAEHDMRTAELTESYLKPHGITTILDVPLLHSGHVIGVVCHEHIGQTRKWTQTDRLFAGSVGDLVALVLEAEQRAELERQRNLLQERLHRTDRLESQGFLAASIAHDFRNLLTAVFAHSQILMDELPPGPLAQSARDIMDAAVRSRELCDKLLAYAGRKPSSLGSIALGEVVQETARVLRARVPAHVRLSVNVAGAIPRVRGDATEIHRAVLNLVVNALDAVQAGGGSVHLSVRRGSNEPTPGDAEMYDFRSGGGDTVLLEVSDDGVGMSTEVRRQMFQPFFSTKADGHGFGLSTVFGTVRGHAGAIEVKSALGRGTTFRIWLPCE